MQLDGRYRGKVKVGEDADGEPIFKYGSGRTKAELAENLDEIRKEYTFGIDKVDRDITFSAYTSGIWFPTYKEPHLHKSNKRTYLSILNAHYLAEFEDRQLRSIRRPEMQRFLNDRADFKASYMRKLVMIGRQIFRDAVEDGYIDRNPMTRLTIPECAGSSRRALTLAERAAVLSVVNSEPNAILAALLFYEGFRPGEAYGLMWDYVEFDKMRIKIVQDIDYAETPDGKPDTLKNENSERYTPMSRALAALLWPRRGLKGTYVIQSPSTGKWLTSTESELLWDRLMRRAYDYDRAVVQQLLEDTNGQKREPIEHRDAINSHAEKRERLQRSVLTPYYLRHNYASMLHAKKVDAVTAASWMGNTPKTMMEYYIHLDEAQEKIDTALYDDVFDEAASK